MAVDPSLTVDRYYAYYDKKTGEVLSVTNERVESYESGIEVTFEEYDNFARGVVKLHEYQVGFVRQADNTTVLKLSPKIEDGYCFKNNMFEWISEPPTDTTELVVTWSNDSWKFALSDACKARIADNLIASTLVFFVTVESDFDFLIRTILVDTTELLSSNQVVVPFESSAELKIDKISISSKLVFESYGLIINDN
jgi:hypothetical protein